MWKKIIGTLIVILLVGAGAWQLGRIVRPTDTDRAKLQVEAFHSLPENTVDVIVYGSSHAQRGMNVLEMYRRYGIGAYNYGENGQKLNGTLLYIKDSFTAQHPRIAVIETYNVANVHENVEINSEIYYARYVKNKPALRQYLRQCLGKEPERYLLYSVPLLQFHDNWNTLTEQSLQPIITSEDDNWCLKALGFVPSEKVQKGEIPDWTTFEQERLSPLVSETLDEIVRTCREQGTEIIFYTSPDTRGYKYNDALEKYAAEHGCVYLDLYKAMDEVGLDGKTDFQDTQHLNTSGATKVADYIGRYISEHYQLRDMRLVENNSWEKALAQAAEAEAKVPTIETVSALPGKVAVSWSEVNGAEKYNLQRRAYDGNAWGEWSDMETALIGTDYDDPTAALGMKYAYRVRAFVEEWGSFSAEAKVTNIPAPEAVTAAVANGKITVKWSAVDGAEKYQVQRRAYDGNTWSEWENRKSSLTETSYTDKSVEQGTTYEYRVKAYAGEWSAPSAAATAKTAGVPAPETVTAAAAKGKITVKWSAVDGAEKYQVQRRAYDGKTWSEWENRKSALTETSYTDKSVVPGTEYEYRVKAFAGEWGAASAAVAVKAE